VTNKDDQKTNLNELLEELMQQKSELFEQTFLTAEDKKLIESLPEDKREPVRQALLDKGKLFSMLKDKLLRISADYANFQKRIPKLVADSIDYEKERIIKSLLPVLDNFEHTLKSAAEIENAASITSGVQIIYNHLLDILKSYDVEQIKTEAREEKFNPSLHNALMQRSEPDKEDNIILEELQKGYKLNGRVIRPSRVAVNRIQKEGEKAAAEDETTDME
jgi:molecular chaperone GrpE